MTQLAASPVRQPPALGVVWNADGSLIICGLPPPTYSRLVETTRGWHLTVITGTGREESIFASPYDALAALQARLDPFVWLPPDVVPPRPDSVNPSVSS